ncbi:MAG: hypothetical protein FJX61_02675 [Alphaproteobacteria bacterium]|nr:hypothetical protein [Alphaproteobacteria bacterium]
MNPRVGAALLAIAILAGCAADLSVRSDAVANHKPAYDPFDVWHAGKSGGIPTLIYGNPFALDEAAAHEAVRAQLKLPGWHQDLPFTLVSATAPRRGLRLAFVFNPSKRLSEGDGCGDVRDIALADRSAITRVAAAFCAGERLLAEVAAEAPVAGPADPTFTALLDRTLRDLLPLRNPSVFDGRACVPPSC